MREDERKKLWASVEPLYFKRKRLQDFLAEQQMARSRHNRTLNISIIPIDTAIESLSKVNDEIQQWYKTNNISYKAGNLVEKLAKKYYVTK